MQAVAVFPTSRRLSLLDHPEPAIVTPCDIKLRILEVGICGTDRELARFKFGTAPEGSDYLVLGHECLAEVIEVGTGITHFSPGDLVVPEVRRPCAPPCGACGASRPDHCVTGNYTEGGILGKHGYLTEFAVENEQHLHRIPSELRGVGVLVEPLTVVEKAFASIQQLRQRVPWSGRNTVVLGAGAIGLLGAMVLRAADFDVSIYSRIDATPEREAIAQAIGAQFINAERVPVDELVHHTGPIDVIFEAAGAPELTFAALSQLGPNGIFMVCGAGQTQQRIEIEANRILLNLIVRNQVVIGTVNAGPFSFDAAIHDLGRFGRRWPGALESLITSRFPIRETVDRICAQTGIKNIVAVG